MIWRERWYPHWRCRLRGFLGGSAPLQWSKKANWGPHVVLHRSRLVLFASSSIITPLAKRPGWRRLCFKITRRSYWCAGIKSREQPIRRARCGRARVRLPARSIRRCSAREREAVAARSKRERGPNEGIRASGKHRNSALMPLGKCLIKITA